LSIYTIGGSNLGKRTPPEGWKELPIPVDKEEIRKFLEDYYMKNKLIAIVFIIILTIIGFVIFSMYNSNKKIESYQFSEDELEIVETFKDVTLNPFLNNPNRTVKWKKDINLYVNNLDSPNYIPEYVQLTVGNINNLIQENNIKVNLTQNQNDSNVKVFIGKRVDVMKLDFELMDDTDDEPYGLALVSVMDRNHTIYRCRIFIESNATYEEQFSTFLEEMMHCIGFVGHTENTKSILYEERDEMNITEYNDFDASLIRLLYHPYMYTGLNAAEVEKTAKKIFMEN